MITSKHYFKHLSEPALCNILLVFRKVLTNHERRIFIALKSSVTRKLKDKKKGNRGACLGTIHSGDKVFVRILSEKGDFGKMKSYWGKNVCTVVEAKDQEGIIHTVKSAKQHIKIRILHRNLLLPWESLPE